MAAIGHNPKRSRLLNARTLLNLCRRGQAISRAEMARSTGLSHPAASKIVTDLERGGYLVERSTRRGSVGSPSKLYGIAPNAALSFGMNIGRRSLQIVLIDLCGTIIRSETIAYRVPRRDDVLKEIRRHIADWTSNLRPGQRDRLIGVGVCSPEYFGFSGDELGYPPSLGDEWRNFRAQDLVEDLTPVAVFEENDANAAARAENEFGLGRTVRNFFHVFVGTFIGGGLVLDGRLVKGPQGLAANYGPFPVLPSSLSSAPPPTEPFESLFRRASLYVLLRHLRAGGAPASTAQDLETLDPKWRPLVEEWRLDAAAAIMQSIIGLTSVIDVEAIVIDGSLPPGILSDLVSDVDAMLTSHADRILAMPALQVGQIGSQARAIGAALVPFDRLIWSAPQDAGRESGAAAGALPFMAME